MNKLILIRMCQLGLILFLMTACVSVNPGEFQTSYQQIVLQKQDPIKKVTILQLAAESQKEMIAQQGTVVVGKSQFEIDSDDIDWDVLNAQAKSQAKKIKANVVLLSQAYLKDTTKTKTVEIKSEFQKVAEDIPLVIGGETSSESSTKESKTTGTKNNHQTETKGQFQRKSMCLRISV